MRALNKFLLVLLAGQLGLVAWIYSRDGDLSRFEPDQPLLPVDMAVVDKIVINEKDGDSLVLVQKEGKWVLPKFQDFPVSAQKLKDFLKNLEGLKTSWPVGQTALAAKQLKVTEDNFENRVRLYKGEEMVGDLLFGSSPSFRKVHARLHDGLRTYAIDFDRYQARSNPADWYDRSLLKFPSKDLSRIDMGAFVLKREDAGFVLEDLSEAEQVRSEAVSRLVNDVTGMTFESVLENNGKETFEKGELILEFTLEPGEGEKIRYTVTAPEEADAYVLKTSQHPYYFKVQKSRVDRLRALEREQLVEKKVEKKEEKAEAKQSPVESGESRESD